ncbi:hypothetical protein [Nonomuraea sp. NPDC005650]|uniref:hypothetical protein n=1 Tax=Nonomuraea sp. NPDC005650 TaxID=3157045 RepID=UPI0033A722F4
MNGLIWIVGYPIFLIIGMAIGYLVVIRPAGRAIERAMDAAAQTEKKLLDARVNHRVAQAAADAYGDALKDILDLADWSAGLPDSVAIARVAEVIPVAHQVLETGSYPGRLRATQDALEQAEREIQDLQVENVRVAELAVAPQ